MIWNFNMSVDEESFDDRLADFYKEGEPSLNEVNRSAALEELLAVSSRYRDEKLVASGGMKEIFRVFDEATNRYVAMAMPLPGAPVEVVDQFIREAHLTAGLDHPNIIEVHDVGVDDDSRPYFTMTLLGGRSLRDVVETLEQGEENRRRLLHIFIQVCDAVAYAHSRGVVHLDIKPENIQIGDFHEVVLCDWGLARVTKNQEAGESDEELLLDPDLLNDLTVRGAVRGTPGYMAPEQLDGHNEYDERADVYALGVLLRVLMTLQLPQNGRPLTSKDAASESDGASRESEEPAAHFPKSLQAVCLRATAHAPSKRYSNVGSLRDDVESYLTGRATSAEDANLGKELRLLYFRNRRFCNTILVALCVIAIGSALFMKALQETARRATFAQEAAEKSLATYLEARSKYENLERDFTASLLEDNRQLIRMADFDSAVEKLRLALEKTPEDEEIWKRMGVTLFMMQRFNAASSCFDERDRGIVPATARRWSEEKPDSQLLSAERMVELIDEINQHLPLKFKMQLYDAVARSSVDEHALVVEAIVRAANPDWKNGSFSYNSHDKSLWISGDGLVRLRRNNEGRDSILSTLPIEQLVIESESFVDAKEATLDGLLRLDLAETGVREIDPDDFPSLRKLHVSQEHFGRERLQELRDHFIARARQDLEAEEISSGAVQE